VYQRLEKSTWLEAKAKLPSQVKLVQIRDIHGVTAFKIRTHLKVLSEYYESHSVTTFTVISRLIYSLFYDPTYKEY